MKKKINFSKKWIIVTGAARGLGKEMTKHLIITEGARVIAVDVKEELLQDLAKEMNEYVQNSVIPITADLSSEDEIRRVFKDITEKYSIFGLVNNAGVTHYGAAESTFIDFYQKMFEINFLAAMKLSLLFIDHFKEKGEGCILNITSLGGIIPIAYQNIYSASKHALQSFSQALYEELKGTGIDICIYAPGGINTSMIKESGLSDHFGSSQFGILDSRIVAVKAINSMKKKRDFATSSFFDYLSVSFCKIVPGKITRRFLSGLYKPMFDV